MKKKNIILIILILLAILLISIGSYLLYQNFIKDKNLVYDEKYACSELKKNFKEPMDCKLVNKADDKTLIMGLIREDEDYYFTLYLFDLETGELSEAPAVAVGTG